MDVEQAKRIITGLLVSAVAKLTIKRLCQDFEEMAGHRLPFQQLGFRTAEEYLRSMPDIVSLSGTGVFAEVSPVVTKKSAHVNDLISKQKSNLPARRRKRFAAPPRSYTSSGGNRFNNTRYENRPFSRISPTQNNVYNNNRPSTSYAVSDDASFRQSSANIEVGPTTSFSSYDQNNVYTQNINSSYLSPTYDHDITKDLTKLSTSVNTHLPAVPDLEDEEEENQLEDAEITRYNSSSNEYPQEDQIESIIPSDMQDNLRQLIEEFPEGLWCAKLPDEYQKKFKRPLNYRKYQYRSVIELCSDLPRIFRYVQPSTDDYLLFDKRRPMPNVEHLFTDVSDIPTGQRDANRTLLSEIPELDWASASFLLPADIVHLGEHIERTFLDSETQVGHFVNITVGEVYDPSKFYIMLKTGSLTQMKKNLCSFFKQESNKYVIPEQLQTKGLYCVAFFMDNFDRVVIISTLPDVPGFVKVLFIDYGTVGTVECDKIHYLPAMFKDVPAQAIRARLFNICPPVSDSPWSMQAADRFRELLGFKGRRRDFSAEIMYINKEDLCVEIYLADKTDRNNIFYINDILCNEKHAIYADQDQEQKYYDPACAPLIEFLYLTPLFEELETGRAAHLSQVQYAFQNNIPVHHYLPHYFPKPLLEDAETVERNFEVANDNYVFKQFPLKKPVSKDFNFSLFPEEFLNDIKRHIVPTDLTTENYQKEVITMSKTATDSLGMFRRKKILLSGETGANASSSTEVNDSMSILPSIKSLSDGDVFGMSSLSFDATAKGPLNKSLPSNFAFKSLNTSGASALNSGSVTDANILDLDYNSKPKLQTHMKNSIGSDPYSNHYSNSNTLESLRVPPKFSPEKTVTSPESSNDIPSSVTTQNGFNLTNPFLNYHKDPKDNADARGSNPFLEDSEEPSQITSETQEMLCSIFKEWGVKSEKQNQVACASHNNGCNDTAVQQDSQNTIGQESKSLLNLECPPQISRNVLATEPQKILRPPPGFGSVPLRSPALSVPGEALQPKKLSFTALHLYQIQHALQFVHQSNSHMSQMSNLNLQSPNLDPLGKNSSLLSFIPQISNINPHFQNITPQLPFCPRLPNVAPNTLGGPPYPMQVQNNFMDTNSMIDAALVYAYLNKQNIAPKHN